MARSTTAFSIRNATRGDVPLLLELIRELAEYEQLAGEAVASADDLREALFGPDRVAYAVIATSGDEVAGFALYFFNFSTFVGRPGLYLEDLFVRPAFRQRGIGRGLLAHLARIAVDRRCGRMEWSVLDWNEMALAVYRAIGAREMSAWRLMRLTGEPLTALAADATAVPPPSAR
jgi:GNAT superfamily N-acetyltransferase